MKRIRVINKTRAMISSTILLLIILSASFVIIDFFSTSVVEAMPQTVYVEYTVSAGDTLWQIAKDHTPSDMDIRAFIYEIEQANALTSSTIRPGQTLFIPAFEEEDIYYVAQSNHQ